MRKTKIVATIGPSSSDRETLTQLMDAGLNVARLNFSHGTHESHAEMINTIRELSKQKKVELRPSYDVDFKLSGRGWYAII